MSIAEGQLRDFQARIGQPFSNDAYQAELTTLRDQLKSSLAGKGLSGVGGTTPETGDQPPLTSSELAGRIKALKAEHTIEATQERLGVRRIDAEEPVTARIRRHAASDRPTETEVQGDRHRRGLSDEHVSRTSRAFER